MSVVIKAQVDGDKRRLDIFLDNELLASANLPPDADLDLGRVAHDILRDSEHFYEMFFSQDFVFNTPRSEWEKISNEASERLQKIRRALRELSSSVGNG